MKLDPRCFKTLLGHAEPLIYNSDEYTLHMGRALQQDILAVNSKLDLLWLQRIIDAICYGYNAR